MAELITVPRTWKEGDQFTILKSGVKRYDIGKIKDGRVDISWGVDGKSKSYETGVVDLLFYDRTWIKRKKEI